MPKYAIYSPTGEEIVDVDRVVECPPEDIAIQLATGEAFLECDAQPHHKINTSTNVLVEVPEEVIPEDTRLEYMQRRSDLYPSVGAQLDMLWHAMDEGTLPMVPAFYNSIKVVKDAVPKEGAIPPVVIYRVEEIPEDDLLE